MSTQTKGASEGMIFRKTNAQTGRHVSVTPQNSMMRHLAYGRIILNSSMPAVSFSAGGRETALICLSGRAVTKTGGREFELGQYDAIYIPRDSVIEVSTKSETDIAEFSSDVEDKYPLQVVRYAETSQDPGLKFSTGGPGSSRQLNMLIAKNVEAGRLVAGFTHSDPGNWTSWPPHEHAKNAGRDVCVLRYAGAGLWHSTGIQQRGVSGTCYRSARRRRGADAQRVSSQCFRTRTSHSLFVGDGGAS